MSLVLIVEDEPVLRSSVARGLSKLRDVEVVTAGTVEDAVRLIDFAAPDLVLSDLDLPERSGVELLSELDRRGLHIPVIYVSAYLGTFRSQIPQRANIETLEKPVPLEELRSVVTRHLQQDEPDDSPFSLDEYIQLSCMGRHSVVIQVQAKSGTGEIVIWAGEMWSARDHEGGGEDAFYRIAKCWFRDGIRVSCRTLKEPPTTRDIEGGKWQGLLMDAVRIHDETARNEPDLDLDGFDDWGEDSLGGLGESPTATPSTSGTAPEAGTSVDPEEPELSFASVEPDLGSWSSAGAEEEPEEEAPQWTGSFLDEADLRDSSPPSRPPPADAPAGVREAFARLIDDGVDALLSKRYPEALEAFLEAEEMMPGDPQVTTNISRLRTLGYGAESEGEGEDR